MSHAQSIQPAIPKMAHRQGFIDAMRHVASSIAVVTTQNSDESHGATVSTFNSVSADPPCVLVCLKSDSRIAKGIRQNKNYCVNLLPQGATWTADRFAGKQDHLIDNRFDDIDYHHDEISGPVIVGSHAFLCSLADSYEVGTHTVFFGNVVKIIQVNNQPLIWHDGRFCQLMPLSDA